tara:strand:- start:309 stop:461 length:153 start_codon:yes stop_codon:yes gene_type:complete
MKHKVGPKYLITAGLFIGIGVGMLIGEVAAGTLIGLGIGYLASYLENKKK